MSHSILLMENDAGLAAAIAKLLAAAGYRVEAVADGLSGCERALDPAFDLIVLEMALPGRNGFEICRRVREKGMRTPMLMLTGRADMMDRVVGLGVGADDYLRKPFDPAELPPRVEALLRHGRNGWQPEVSHFRFGEVAVDFERAEAMKDGQRITLGGKELQLLRYLVENRGRVLSREELLRNVWEYANNVSSRTLDTHIAWLRRKIEPNPQSPEYIHTIRGRGYRFSG